MAEVGREDEVVARRQIETLAQVEVFIEVAPVFAAFAFDDEWGFV